MKKSYSDRLHDAIPGGAHTYSRGDDQYPANAPQILERGDGAYVFTPDGEQFLDYGMALRAVTLGYGREEIAQAAIKQIHNGNNLTRASLIELEAAEAMCALFPSVDMVKFAKNGSTVTTAALKVARGYTGRQYIARCADHPFFSYDDWFIGDTPLTLGIPEQHAGLTLNFRYNDPDSLAALFQKYPDQIAAVILEPAATEHPRDNFLHQVQALCRQNGAVFILDEMITGFRWDLRGAQKYYNITPDLCTFGKGMANGFSVAALGGRRDIMEVGGIRAQGKERLFLISTTHGAEMCGLGALVETIKFYQRHDVTAHLWSYGQRLTEGMNAVARECGVQGSFSVGGVACSPYYATLDAQGQPSPALRTLFSQEMIKNKVLMPWIALSYAHGDKELEQTLEATRAALKVYKKALDEGVEKYLVGPAIKPVFRKYN